jgi:hypothetical protein
VKYTTGDVVPSENDTYIARQVPAYNFGVDHFYCQ